MHQTANTSIYIKIKTNPMILFPFSPLDRSEEKKKEKKNFCCVSKGELLKFKENSNTTELRSISWSCVPSPSHSERSAVPACQVSHPHIQLLLACSEPLFLKPNGG